MNPTTAITPEPDAAAIMPVVAPDVSHLVTEDDTPVDNFYSAKQQRLLVSPLYTSWTPPGEGSLFLADANIGLYHAVNQAPLVPDFLLSLDVQAAADWFTKSNRAYLSWIFGKLPDVVAEIVSNAQGGEADVKLSSYARMGVPYYVIHDPARIVGPEVLRVFGLKRRSYEPVSPEWLPEVGLGLTLWQGAFEGRHDSWLRWCDREGRVLPTGDELVARERQRGAEERQRAEDAEQLAARERQRALEAEHRAEILAQRLRELGGQP